MSGGLAIHPGETSSFSRVGNCDDRIHKDLRLVGKITTLISCARECGISANCEINKPQQQDCSCDYLAHSSVTVDNLKIPVSLIATWQGFEGFWGVVGTVSLAVLELIL